MSKSLLVISGLGLASCVLLSLMMQHLLQVKADRRRSPLAAELEDLFRSQLAGPVDTEFQDREGKRTLVVHFKVIAGLEKQRLGLSLGGLVWRRALGGPEEAPQAVVLSIGDDGGSKVEEIVVPRPPMFGGARAEEPISRRPAASGSAKPGTAPPAPPAPPPSGTPGGTRG